MDERSNVHKNTLKKYQIFCERIYIREADVVKKFLEARVIQSGEVNRI